MSSIDAQRELGRLYHAAIIRVLCGLREGDAVPKDEEFELLLGCDRSTAGKRKRKALRDIGAETQLRGRRLYIRRYKHYNLSPGTTAIHRISSTTHVDNAVDGSFGTRLETEH